MAADLREAVSVAEAAGEGSVEVDAAVAQEGPPAADVLAAFHVNVDNGNFFAVVGRAEEKFALRTCHEA